MSDLQKAIRRELHNFNTFTTYYVSSEEQFESGVNTCAKNIEKAVCKLLLAPEAVEAAHRTSQRWLIPASVGRSEVEGIITAALAAAGGDDHDDAR